MCETLCAYVCMSTCIGMCRRSPPLSVVLFCCVCMFKFVRQVSRLEQEVGTPPRKALAFLSLDLITEPLSSPPNVTVVRCLRIQ